MDNTFIEKTIKELENQMHLTSAGDRRRVEHFLTQKLTEAMERTRKETYAEIFKKIYDLPVFANKYEREYQIGINEVFKQIKSIKYFSKEVSEDGL